MSFSQWKLDYGHANKGSKTSDPTFNPPGFFRSQQDFSNIWILNVRPTNKSTWRGNARGTSPWDQRKVSPMNMFMMYMAGRSVSIFPIMMVGMMLWRPAKALFSVNATFKPLESPVTGSMILHKIVFLLGNIGAIGLAIYKVHTMGLLPNTPSDWLEFIPQPNRAQYSIVTDAFY